MKTKKSFINASFFVFYFLIFIQNTFATENKKNIKIKDLKAWIGKPASKLLSHPKFGPPSDKITVGDEAVITYRQIFNVSGHINDDLTVNIYCRRNFIYNKKGIITATSEEGYCQDTTDYLPDTI